MAASVGAAVAASVGAAVTAAVAASAGISSTKRGAVSASVPAYSRKDRRSGAGRLRPPEEPSPSSLAARWEVSQPVEINNIATVQVTTFTLRGRTGTTMTIAGETKVVGLDQKLGDVQVSDISGQGTVELVVDTAKLYPRMKRTVSTKMRLRQGAEDVTVMMQLGSAFAPK